MARHAIVAGIIAFAMGLPAAEAQTASWRQVRPSNTGIPGLQLNRGRFAPDGTFWTSGRWPFWGEGGIGIYDVQNDLWTTLSNVDTPMPSQWVNGWAFDAAGAAWIATDGGLVRKHGEQWTLWTTANAPFLHNKIKRVAIAPNGDVWVNNSGVQTSDAALFRLSGQSWTMFKVGQQIPFPLPWAQLNGMFFGNDGHLWVTNQSWPGVAEFDGQAWTYRDPGFGALGGGLSDPAGDVWFAPGSAGGNSFYRFRRQANAWDEFGSFNTPFVQTSVTMVALDPQGRVHAGNWAGQVIRYEGGSWTQVANVGDAVYGIDFRANGELWVTTLGNGTTGAVRRLDALGNTIRIYNTWNTGMVDFFIDRFDLDAQGNLWFACGEGGLSRFDGERWRNWGNHNAGSEPYPFAGNEPMGGFYLDASGTGWMGGNGIARWDPATGQFTGFWNWQNNPGMGVTLFTTFAEDAAGNLFAASEGGSVFRFNGSQWVVQPPTAGGYTSSYAGLKSDSLGRIWTMGWLKAWRWDGAAWSEVGQTWNIFDRGGINCFDIAPDDTLWIGTNEGLLRVAISGATSFFTTANSPLPAKEVQGIDVRADGVVALSSHEFGAVTPFPTGVAVIQGDIGVPANWKIYQYGIDPIPHYQLGSVIWDAEGNLWISAISEACAVLLNTSPTCYPDCNGDAALNLADFGCFQTKFALQDPYADCNGDGQLNLADFGCFQTSFAVGCP